jgi:hypothetical protein
MINENENKCIPLLDNREDKSSRVSFMENNTTSIINPLKGDLYGEANCLSKLFFFWSFKILKVYLI